MLDWQNYYLGCTDKQSINYLNIFFDITIELGDT